MTSVVFVLSLVVIAATTFAIESGGELAPDLRRPAGLLTWLTRGNWPAKIGAVLVIVGLAALMRYSLIHIDIPPQLKLLTGIGTALALAFASTLVRGDGARRAVSLALGGAAFGVAYLTAYSAFALFGYLDSGLGLAFLAMTSAAAAVFAVRRSALSIALLSMIGAFLAPAFAIGDPGPAVVFGYYVAASLITLAMVSQSGWRALIHLSFLFTLAGGLFFTWTAGYYAPEHAAVMQPMLLLLAAVHVAMPLVERSSVAFRWIERLDFAYLITLPVLSTLAAVAIGPDRAGVSLTILALGATWLVAALLLRMLKRDGALAHLLIGALLLAIGSICRFRDLPWELIALAFAVASLAIAGRHTTRSRLHDVLVGTVLLLGAVHVLFSAPVQDTGGAFIGLVVERLLGASLLVTAGVLCRRIRHPLDAVLLLAGAGWAVFAIGSELIRLHLATGAVLVHWLAVLTAALLWLGGARLHRTDRGVGVLVVAIILTAIWAAGSITEPAAWASLAAAPLALVALAFRPVADEDPAAGVRTFAALSAPVVAIIWGWVAGFASTIHAPQFALLCGVLAACVVLLLGRAKPERCAEWFPQTSLVFGVALVAALLGATLVAIARSPWAVALEVACLSGLGILALTRRSSARDTDPALAALLFGIALVGQANLLRWFGPAGSLSIAAVLTMQAPALVSLLWAATGSALTVLGIRVGSRRLWVGGAALLVATAVKFVLIDFGALGDLANIVAVIAAGGMFLLVGWLAPIPPSRRREETPDAEVGSIVGGTMPGGV
jgi:uncharacterized membrane protein